MIYIITQWGGAGHSQITAVQRLQNQIARWITGQGRRVKIFHPTGRSWLVVHKRADKNTLTSAIMESHPPKQTCHHQKQTENE